MTVLCRTSRDRLPSAPPPMIWKLARQPRLLIFDEAMPALDSLTEEHITNTVRAISARGTQITLLIAHCLSTIMHADTIFVLEKDRIVESGGHAALPAEKGFYYAMCRQQIGERPVPVVDMIQVLLSM